MAGRVVVVVGTITGSVVLVVGHGEGTPASEQSSRRIASALVACAASRLAAAQSSALGRCVPDSTRRRTCMIERMSRP